MESIGDIHLVGIQPWKYHVPNIKVCKKNGIFLNVSFCNICSTSTVLYACLPLVFFNQSCLNSKWIRYDVPRVHAVKHVILIYEAWNGYFFSSCKAWIIWASGWYDRRFWSIDQKYFHYEDLAAGFNSLWLSDGIWHLGSLPSLF